MSYIYVSKSLLTDEKHACRQFQIASYHVWATVKRRRCRMLLFTSNFLKKHGEFLGELRGEILGDVGLFPGGLGSSSSKCICSLKVLMQTSGSEAVSSLEEFFAVMSYVECWLSPSKTKTSNIAETQLQVRTLGSLQTISSLISEAKAPMYELLRARAAYSKNGKAGCHKELYQPGFASEMRQSASYVSSLLVDEVCLQATHWHSLNSFSWIYQLMKYS